MGTLLERSSFDSSLGYREVDPKTVAQVGDSKVRVIDVREPHEYFGELGHLDSASLVPLATLPFTAQQWDREFTYLLVCRSGRRSGTAVQLLEELGFEQVINLRGGMLAQRAFEAERDSL